MKRLLTANEAGELLSVPCSWVLREARAGRVPHVRLGRYVRFDADALDAWWRARVEGPQRGVPGSTPGPRRKESA
jgi:excisionase family DNA binding protein